MRFAKTGLSVKPKKTSVIVFRDVTTVTEAVAPLRVERKHSSAVNPYTLELHPTVNFLASPV